MRVHDVLAVKGTEVHDISLDTPVLEAVNKLVRHGIGSLAVVDEEGRLAGILTERDILRLTSVGKGDLHRRKVREVMTKNVFTVGAGEDVDVCLRAMAERRVRHLPVMENGRIVGLISQRDLVNARLHEAEFFVRRFGGYLAGRYPA